MVRIVRVECSVFRAPTATPIRNAFATIADRSAVYVRIEDSDGAAGWGEIWCTLPSVAAEHRARLFDALVAPRLIGWEIGEDPGRFWHEYDAALHVWALQTGEPGPFAAVLAGADIALRDLAARRAGVPLWRQLGGSDSTPVAAYASGINAGRAALDEVAGARAKGFQALKIKVGFGEAEDLATLTPVMADLAPGETVMVDVNQGWDVDRACDMVRALAHIPLRWIEEPLRADRPAAEWAQVRAAASSPLAAGENLFDAAAFDNAIRDGEIAILQPDLCKWGGLTGVLPAARAIVDAGLTFCPHFLGGGIGLFASLHLLAAVRGPGVLEVDVNPNPLREALIDGAFHLRDGKVAVPDGPGFGFFPDLGRIAGFRTLHLEQRQ